MQIDIEECILNFLPLEETIFGHSDIHIKKNSLGDKGEKGVVPIGGDPKQIVMFYNQLDHNLLKTQRLGMFSSGTTKGNQILYLRSKESVFREIIEVEGLLSGFRSEKILIMVTPNHSFGLIPALLTSRRLSCQVYLNMGQAPLEVIQQLFALKPQVIFAVPAHIRLVAEWVKKKNIDISFLKRILYGGAVLQKDLIEFFENRDVALTSLYGTTQTGVISIQQKIDSKYANNCGIVLKNCQISFSKERQEILVLTSDDQWIATGDKGFYNDNNLIVQGRLDSIIFKNGNKIDLQLVEELIGNLLETRDVKIQFEKNINSQPEIICTLPKVYESAHRMSFEKIKSIVPPYALPERYYYV